MNQLFKTLRRFTERSQASARTEPEQDALPGFYTRIDVLIKYAERASAYEDELMGNFEQIIEMMDQFQGLMEQALDDGRDRDALEYLRLAARIRPQRDLIDQELRAFHAVAADLLERFNTLIANLEEAREYARSAEVNPAATEYLDQALNRLTRYFVMLERVTIARHRELPERLAAQIGQVVDDRQLDLELATFILQRRRALGSGRDFDY